MDEMKSMEDELIHWKDGLLAVKESKGTALRWAELMETDPGLEKQKNEELPKPISENYGILSSNLASIKAESAKSDFFSGMEAELELVTMAVLQSQEQMKEMKRQLTKMEDSENELLAKTKEIDYLKLELNQVKELHHSSPTAALDVADEFNMLNSEMELMKKANSEYLSHIAHLEGQVKQSGQELGNAREEVNCLNRQVEVLTSKMQSTEDEMSKSAERELELQIEIATLKSEVHKCRSRIAAAEAAEARAMSTQAGLHLAVQQLAIEAQAAKSEVQRLKLEAKRSEVETVTEDGMLKQRDEAADTVADSTGFCSGITISIEEYKSFIQKAEEVDKMKDFPPKDECQLLEDGKSSEVEFLKEELEAAHTDVSDLRFALEEAVRRAELAENAKLAVEDQLRKWRERHQQKRRAAAESLQMQAVRQHRNTMASDRPSAYETQSKKEGFHEASASRDTSMNNEKYSNYVPLGKILNIKF